MPTPEEKLFTRYVDPTGELSNRKLRLGTWYVRHEEFMYKIVVGLLFVWSIFAVGGSALYILSYAAEGYWADEASLTAELNRPAVNVAARTRLSAKPLNFGNIGVYDAAFERWNIVAEAVNPNTEWIAVVTYKFRYDGGETRSETSVVYPGETRPLPLFGAVEGVFPTNVNLHVEHVAWRRISARTVINPETFMAERKDFILSEVVIGAPPGTETLSVLPVKVVLQNRTAYGYWEVSGVLELRRAGAAVGYAPVYIQEFRSGDTETVDVRVNGVEPPIDEVVFFPNIDFVDTSAYIPPEVLTP